jgi:hypothetical protein
VFDLAERGARQAGQQLVHDPLERLQGKLDGFDRRLPSPRLGPSGVSAEAIHRPFISRSRTSTQKAEQVSRSTIMAKV